MNLKEIGWEDVDCVCLSQDRGKWQAFVNTVMMMMMMMVIIIIIIIIIIICTPHPILCG